MSSAWKWELLESIAKATTPNQLMEAWAYYRHKRKSAKYYLKCLHRLVQLGKIDRNDWRYQLLCRRLAVFKRRWIHLPRLMLYLSLTGNRSKVEWWSKSIHRLYYRYSPRQLGMVLEALSRVRLQDEYLFNLISNWLSNRLHSPKADSNLLVKLLETHSRVALLNWDLFDAITTEFSRRVQLAAETKKYNSDLREKRLQIQSEQNLPPLIPEGTPDWDQSNAINANFAGKEKFKTLKILTTPKDYLPNIKHLIKAAVYFSEMKYYSFTFFEMMSLQIHYILNSGKSLPSQLISQLLASYCELGIYDVSLFERLLAHYSRYIYDYSPDDCSLMAKCFAQVLPYSLMHVKAALKAAEENLMDIFHTLSLKGVDSFLSFYRLQHPSDRHRLSPTFESVLIERLNFLLSDPTRRPPMTTNIPRILYNVASFGITFPPLINNLSREITQQMHIMETDDCILTLQAMKRLNRYGYDYPESLEFPWRFFNHLESYMISEFTRNDVCKILHCINSIKNVPSTLKSALLRTYGTEESSFSKTAPSYSQDDNVNEVLH